MPTLFPYTVRQNTTATIAHNLLSEALYKAALEIVGQHDNLNNFVKELTKGLSTVLAKNHDVQTVDAEIQFEGDYHVVVGARLGGADTPLVIIVELGLLVDFMTSEWAYSVDRDKLGNEILDAVDNQVQNGGFKTTDELKSFIGQLAAVGVSETPKSVIWCDAGDTSHLYLIDHSAHPNHMGAYQLGQYVQIKLTEGAGEQTVTQPFGGSWHDYAMATISENEQYPQGGLLVPYFNDSVTGVWNLMANSVNPDNIRHQVSSRALKAAMEELALWAGNYANDIMENVDREFNYDIEATSSVVEVIMVDRATGQREVARFTDEDVAEYLAHGLDWHPMAATFWIPQTRKFGAETTVQ